MGERKMLRTAQSALWKHTPGVTSHCATMEGSIHPMWALVKRFSTPEMTTECCCENKLILFTSVSIWLTLKRHFASQKAVHSTVVDVCTSLPHSNEMLHG